MKYFLSTPYDLCCPKCKKHEKNCSCTIKRCIECNKTKCICKEELNIEKNFKMKYKSNGKKEIENKKDYGEYKKIKEELFESCYLNPLNFENNKISLYDIDYNLKNKLNLNQHNKNFEEMEKWKRDDEYKKYPNNNNNYIPNFFNNKCDCNNCLLNYHQQILNRNRNNYYYD
jgi:hypothetical protein